MKGINCMIRATLDSRRWITRKSGFSILILFALSEVGCSKQDQAGTDRVVKRPGEPDYVRVRDEDLMNRAKKKAADTRGEFIEALKNKRPTMKAFAIKKGFAYGKDGVEHIWMNEVSWNGAVLTGVVNNHPVDTKQVKLGDRVEVKPEELSDWMYLDDGKLKGGYTIRALYYQSSPEEQREMLKHMPFSIPPLDF